MATTVQVVIDCADPARLAQFWAEALHYRLQDPPEGFVSWEAWLEANGVPEQDRNSASAVVDPAGVGPRIYFQRVPEAKALKNRVHLDLNVGGPATDPSEERRGRLDAEVERLVRLGAHKLGEREHCVNMLDPEGNEFDLQ
jgi:hypothetical protein